MRRIQRLSPLPFRGGAGSGGCLPDATSSKAATPHPNLSPEGEGLSGHARHVAIIMDGNGRWAKKRHLPRAIGHKRGVEAVREVVRAARTKGLEALTLYAFSTENWRRPEDEISALMGLLKHFIVSDLDEFVANNVRLKIIGDYRAFAPDIVEMVENALARTAGNDGTTLVVALNYGSQAEIAKAAAKAAAKGAITPESKIGRAHV